MLTYKLCKKYINKYIIAANCQHSIYFDMSYVFDNFIYKIFANLRSILVI